MSSDTEDKLRLPRTINENGEATKDRQPSSKPEDANIGHVDQRCYESPALHANLFKTSPNDIVIAVMGITGSGKSTFIQMMTGQEVKISGDLASCK
jgi:ABC-type bacteriocin/lantibiotic exporter with double-glycine peptidase domain